MKIAIIAAMPGEFQAVAAGIDSSGAAIAGALRTMRYLTGKHEILLVESGIGFSNAARAAEILVRNARPELLISTGFCGGLTAELRVGDVVVADNIVMAVENGIGEIPLQLTNQIRTFVARQRAEGRRIVEGTYVSTLKIGSKRRLAALLSDRHPNPVVEMESGAIARIAAENHIPLLAIRAVSDSASEELEFSLEEFCDPDMRRIRPYRVLLTALRKPRIIPQIVRLAHNSRIAAASLSESVEQLLAGL